MYELINPSRVVLSCESIGKGLSFVMKWRGSIGLESSCKICWKWASNCVFPVLSSLVRSATAC